MYKLAPLSAAIVLALAGQAMAADSTSSQTQDGKENIADVSQTQASFASATQNQTGQGHNHLAVPTASTRDIKQTATGAYNAGHAQQRIGQAQAGDGEFDARVGAVAGLDPIDVFAEVAAALGTQQRDGKQGAAALHGLTNEQKYERETGLTRDCVSADYLR